MSLVSNVRTVNDKRYTVMHIPDWWLQYGLVKRNAKSTPKPIFLTSSF